MYACKRVWDYDSVEVDSGYLRGLVSVAKKAAAITVCCSLGHK